MMKITVCCVAVLLTLTSVSAVQRLKSINDLKKINFGQSVPEESLRLLYWFANTVDIDNNNVIWLTFDPDNQDYGSHQYHNSEGLLDPLPQGQRYYTIGNLHQGTEELPDYVDNHSTDNMRSNMARVIIRVREESRGRRIDRVYITQHYGTFDYRRTYDPDHTYQVTTNLLRQIRDFSVGQSQRNTLSELRDNFGSYASDSRLQEISNTWGNLAPLGLLLFIVIKEKYRPQRAPRRNTQPDFVVSIPENAENKKTSDNGCDCVNLCVSFLVIIFILIIVFFSIWA